MPHHGEADQPKPEQTGRRGFRDGLNDVQREVRVEGTELDPVQQIRGECQRADQRIVEGIQECVRMLLGKSLFKPGVLKEQMECWICENGEYIQIQF